MKQPKVIYEGLIIRGTLPSGAGQDLLTINPATGQLGSISGTPLTATLSSGQIFVGNASNVATAVNVTGDISISNTGVTSIVAGSIVNADINATASIAFSKLAVQTPSRLLGTDGSGFITVLTPTTTEANYLSGVTSAIQTQLNTKQATITGGATTIATTNLAVSRALVSDASGKVIVSATTSTQIGYLSTLSSNAQTQLDGKLTAAPGALAEGDIIYYNGTIWTNLPRGTVGQTLTATASSIQWSSIVGNGIPSGGTTNQYLRKDSNTDYDVVWDTLDLSKISDVTATFADVNILAGADAAGVTDTIIGYLSGLSSNAQIQLDSKRTNDLPQNAIWRGNASNEAEAYPAGTEGYVLTVVAGVPTWAVTTPPGNVSGVAPSTDNALVRWNGTAADSIQNSGIIISDSNNMVFPTAGTIDTSTSNGNTLLLRAYNTGGASYTTMATLTAGASPTFDLNTGTTIGTAYIYRAGGTDVTVADGGTNISSYAAGDILYATGATTLAKLPVSTNGFVLTLDTGLPVWAAPSGGGGSSLTATYVGYGDGANTLTGEAAFTYNATDNILTVPRIAYTATASDPVATVANGQLTYNSTTLDLRGRIGGEWINLTRPSQQNINSNYTVVESDRNSIIYVDTAGGDVTIDIDTLLSIGATITFVNEGANSIIFDPGTQDFFAIDDTCSTQWGWVTIIQKSVGVWEGTGALGTGGGGGGTVTSVTGTSNRITISGTAADPIVDIAATYVGQSSITTLGTIGTGVWQGTPVGVTYGGTGANLSATGGVGQYVKQTSTGAAFTVGTIPASDIASGTALTRVDDTNVTLTLGGAPSTALLTATSLTLGWSGQLAVTRGGTGISSVAQGDLLYGSASNVISALAKNTSATRYLSNTGSSNNPAWAQIDLTNGVTGVLPAANGGTGSTAGAWLLGGNTLGADTVLGGSSGAFGVNIQTNGVTRHAITSAGTQSFSQSAQAATNTFVTFTQATHTAGLPVGLQWTGGAHTGVTTASEIIDWNIDLSSTVTKVAGSHANQRSVVILGRTFSAPSATVLTDAATLYAAAPIAAGSLTMTRAHAFWGRGGWVTADQLLTNSTEGFLNKQSTNIGTLSWISSNVWRMTANGSMSIGPTGSNTLALNSGLGITYTSSAGVSVGHTFSGATFTTANRTFINASQTWTNASSGTNSMLLLNPTWNESGAATTTFYGINIGGVVDLNTSMTAGTIYYLRIAPTLTAILNTNVYGIAIDSSTIKNGFGVATPTAVLQARGANNTVALLAEDDAGNAIASFGESGGNRVIGFFGATPVARQTMGAATAGAVYTATEQTMLQAVYDAIRNIGIGT